MLMPKFQRLNLDWNADPNVPAEEVRATDSEVELRFRLNGFIYPADQGRSGRLVFSNCASWRLGTLNDHGWYLGQCRYGRSAPEWGEFYELIGDDPLGRAPNDWETPPIRGIGDRHFLFYLRDSTFECFAAAWRFERV